MRNADSRALFSPESELESELLTLGDSLTGTFQGPQSCASPPLLFVESSLSGIFSALHTHHLLNLQVQPKRHPLLELSGTAHRTVVTYPSPRCPASIKVRSKEGAPLLP